MTATAAKPAKVTRCSHDAYGLRERLLNESTGLVLVVTRSNTSQLAAEFTLRTPGRAAHDRAPDRQVRHHLDLLFPYSAGLGHPLADRWLADDVLGQLSDATWPEVESCHLMLDPSAVVPGEDVQKIARGIARLGVASVVILTDPNPSKEA